ncbi:MAG: hypothetical protein OEM00_10680 [Burkholderiaceae bacterium]|nr:hypothetical protein [Burkholderiaceae bacterium]
MPHRMNAHTERTRDRPMADLGVSELRALIVGRGIDRFPPPDAKCASVFEHNLAASRQPMLVSTLYNSDVIV